MSGAHFARPRSAGPRRSVPLAAALLAAALFGALAGVSTLAAQAPGEATEPREEEARPSRFSGALAILNTQPVGELETGPGFGVAASGAVALDSGQRIRLRGDVRFAIYGHDGKRACLGGSAGCLIQMDIDTNYSSFYLGFGPELAVPLGGATLLLDATAGLGRFAVDSSIRGISDADESVLDTNNFHDEVFAWSAGGELRVPFSRQVGLTLGAHYLRNGEATYVREGGISQRADGSLDIRTTTTGADQVALTIGVFVHPDVGWTRKTAGEP